MAEKLLALAAGKSSMDIGLPPVLVEGRPLGLGRGDTPGSNEGNVLCQSLESFAVRLQHGYGYVASLARVDVLNDPRLARMCASDYVAIGPIFQLLVGVEFFCAHHRNHPPLLHIPEWKG